MRELDTPLARGATRRAHLGKLSETIAYSLLLILLPCHHIQAVLDCESHQFFPAASRHSLAATAFATRLKGDRNHGCYAIEGYSVTFHVQQLLTALARTCFAANKGLNIYDSGGY